MRNTLLLELILLKYSSPWTHAFELGWRTRPSSSRWPRLCDSPDATTIWFYHCCGFFSFRSSGWHWWCGPWLWLQRLYGIDHWSSGCLCLQTCNPYHIWPCGLGHTHTQWCSCFNCPHCWSTTAICCDHPSPPMPFAWSATSHHFGHPATHSRHTSCIFRMFDLGWPWTTCTPFAWPTTCGALHHSSSSQGVSQFLRRENLLQLTGVSAYCEWVLHACLVQHNGRGWPILELAPRQITHGAYFKVIVPPPPDVAGVSQRNRPSLCCTCSRDAGVTMTVTTGLNILLLTCSLSSTSCPSPWTPLLTADWAKWCLVLALILLSLWRMRGPLDLDLQAPPCETWTAARHLQCDEFKQGPRPLRSCEQAWGLAGPCLRELLQLGVGSHLMLHSLLLELLICLAGGGSIMEHPAIPDDPTYASIWRTKLHLDLFTRAHLPSWSTSGSGVIVQCRWGLGLPKLARHLHDSKDPSLKRPTAVLSGYDRFRTSAAKEYPPKLCEALVRSAFRSLRRRIHSQGFSSEQWTTLDFWGLSSWLPTRVKCTNGSGRCRPLFCKSAQSFRDYQRVSENENDPRFPSWKSSWLEKSTMKKERWMTVTGLTQPVETVTNPRKNWCWGPMTFGWFVGLDTTNRYPRSHLKSEARIIPRISTTC